MGESEKSPVGHSRPKRLSAHVSDPHSGHRSGSGCCQQTLACARASRHGTQRSASYRNRAGRLGKCRKTCRKRRRNDWRRNDYRRRYFSRRVDDPRARIWTRDAGCRQRAADAGRCQRRSHRVLQRVHLRRQQGELTGYSFQIRLLGCGALRERRQRIGVFLQRIGVLLLGLLNVPQSRPDHRIRHQHWSRRSCSDALGLR